MDIETNLRDEVERFATESRVASRAQYLTAKHCARRHTRLGLPSVILSAFVGTAVFTTLSGRPEWWVVVVTGVVAVAAGVLTAVQTFFGYADRAVRHRAAGAQYAGLLRRFELLQLRIRRGDPGLPTLEKLLEELGAVQEAAPDVPDRLYERAVEQTGGPRLRR